MDRVFNVHSGNGSVYVLRELDREENAWHNISVMATEFSESAAAASLASLALARGLTRPPSFPRQPSADQQGAGLHPGAGRQRQRARLRRQLRDIRLRERQG